MKRIAIGRAARLRFLQQVPYFASVSPNRLRELAAKLRERRFRAGQFIFRKGDRCAGLYAVFSGRVRTVMTSAEGREQVLKIFGPGRTFADIPVFDTGPVPADSIALTNCTVFMIPRDDLLLFLRRNPDVSLDVIRVFASRLRAYKQVVEDLSLRNVIARVAKLLQGQARGQSSLVEDSADTSPRYTQEQIAAMVGSVREVVQRALKILEHAGAIQMARGQIEISDIEGLSVWIDSEESAVRAPMSLKRNVS